VLREKAIGYVRSAIEDLAFTSRSSREPGRDGPEDCLSTGMSKQKGRRELGKKDQKKDNNAQFHRAEKGGEGMALKIRTRAKGKPDGRNILESRCANQRG